MEAIGTCIILTLSSDLVLHAEKTFYVLNFSRNLIFVFKLLLVGYSLKFSDSTFILIYKFELVDNGILYDGFFEFIYRIMTHRLQCMSLLSSVGIK